MKTSVEIPVAMAINPLDLPHLTNSLLEGATKLPPPTTGSIPEVLGITQNPQKHRIPPWGSGYQSPAHACEGGVNFKWHSVSRHQDG